MKPFKQLVPWKRIGILVAGLGLLAGAIGLFLRPSVSDLDSSGGGADARPAARPTEPTPAEYDARLSALAKAVHVGRDPGPAAQVAFEGGLVEIGHGGGTFAFDSEGPRHRVFL